MRILALLAPLLLSACAFAYPDRIHYVWDPETAPPAPESNGPPAQYGMSGATFVGLALSGGGNRSGVFSAAGMEALHEHGLLSQTTHISSVSGGGFAAAWHVLNRPDLCYAEDASATRALCDDAFGAFQAAMRHSFFADLRARELAPNRFGSPTRRLSSLAVSLDEAFIGGTTFAELPASPVLLVNAARYDDGRRFVFSNLTLPDETDAPGPLADPRLRAASFSRPGCPAATPGEFSFALAIATSAAFPVAFGPAAIEAPADCADTRTEYWHLGDGGVIENKGIETLEEVALRAIDAGEVERALLINLDAELLADPQDLFSDSNLSLWTSNPARVVDVAMERGRGYHDLVWAELRESAPAPFELISARYTNATMTEWPASCARESRSGLSITEHIAAIPTGLSISACDADLMEAAAHQLVHAAVNAQAEHLRAQGFMLREVAPH
ncbi:MAG: patatin-like phospholipase family protein [Maricaulaceae bacterium]|jgi:predicted acylesterase/phospholipase RssA